MAKTKDKTVIISAIKKVVKRHAPGAVVFALVLLLMAVVIIGAIQIIQNVEARIETRLMLNQLAERQGRLEAQMELLLPKKDIENMAARFGRMNWFDGYDGRVIALTIYRCAAEHGIPPRLVEAMIVIESYRNPDAVSHKGAKGLMQLMPCHLAEGDDPHDPILSIEKGTAYFAECLRDNGGDFAKALREYNSGDPFATYNETISYTERVLERWEEYRS